MVKLNGKKDVKFIKEMVDVVYFMRSGEYRDDMTKKSTRNHYTLRYNAWTGKNGYPEYRVILEHYNGVIFDLVSRDGFETLEHMIITSDSDRNAVNTLIDWLGLVPIEIYRKNYEWYATMYTGLIKNSNLIHKGVSVKDEYMTIVF